MNDNDRVWRLARYLMASLAAVLLAVGLNVSGTAEADSYASAVVCTDSGSDQPLPHGICLYPAVIYTKTQPSMNPTVRTEMSPLSCFYVSAEPVCSLL